MSCEVSPADPPHNFAHISFPVDRSLITNISLDPGKVVNLTPSISSVPSYDPVTRTCPLGSRAIEEFPKEVVAS